MTEVGLGVERGGVLGISPSVVFLLLATEVLLIVGGRRPPPPKLVRIILDMLGCLVCCLVGLISALLFHTTAGRWNRRGKRMCRIANKFLEDWSIVKWSDK